jgi:suppressor of ftsI
MNRKITLLASAIACTSLLWPSSAKAQRFVNEIPVPYQMLGNNYLIDIQPGLHNFDPNGFEEKFNLNVSLATYCYNESGNNGMSYLGPTLVFNEGDVANFQITNNLPGNTATTVHWHGLNIPAPMDGGPHQVIDNDSTWTPFFTVIDKTQTAWYHTHLMDQTTDQVVRGLAGMILVKNTGDFIEAALPNNYGKNDFPIIIQEKGFIVDSTKTATAIKAGEKPGNGKQTLVNGVVGGYLRVPPEMVRLRILNGSPRKMFNIGLSTELNNPTNFAQMAMIATGGGYLEAPIFVDSTMMSVGDRREFMVNFSLYPNGDTVYMSNLSIPSDASYGSTPGNALMAFIVWDPIQVPNPIVTVPTTLVPYALAPGPIFRSREKHLNGSPGPGNGMGGQWMIDSTAMDMMVINDTVLVNTKESWKIVNNTSKSHPFHIHKVQFQITEYHGKYGAGSDSMDFTFSTLPAELVGYKDVQLLREYATMTFVARFDSFPSPLQANMGYMYHCHILTHEDTSMMHQFVVVDSLDFFSAISSIPETEKLVAYPNPATNTISFTGDYQDQGMLRIYDLTGRFIREYEVGDLSNTTINVEDVSRGMFVLVYTSGSKRYVQKVSLQ